MKNRKQRWVIVGRVGLYTGQWLTRKDAIERHSMDKRLVRDPENIDWREVWKRCRKNGDRCVRATITWPKRKARHG